MLVLDTVLQQIDAEITSWPPERGGALLGPRGLDAISRFVFDTDARTTAVTYQPSVTLHERVRDVEHSEGLEYKGLVHSHPGGLDVLSGPDQRELAVGLDRNPHMASYVAPIATAAAGPARGAHEVATPSGKLSFFAASRGQGREAEIDELVVRVVPVADLARRVQDGLGLKQTPELRELVVDGTPVLAGHGHDASGAEWTVIVPWHYGLVSPMLLKDGVQLDLPWDLRADLGKRLTTGIARALTPPAPEPADHEPVTSGVAAEPSLRQWVQDSALDLARVIWERGRASVLGTYGAADLSGYLARTETILPPVRARSRRVIVAGCGSVGSQMAEMLARTGVGSFVLVDPDHVEAPNLSRSSYRATDVGRRKTDALRDLLVGAAPAVLVDRRPARVDTAAIPWLRACVRSADLVVAATDDPAAQLLLNQLAAEQGVPSLYLGLTAGARGGEVLVVVPGATPCYACALAVRQSQPASLRRAVDYGASRLNGEPALGCDIQHLTTAGARLALSLLADPGTALASFAEHVVGDGSTYLTLGMTPDYWFYPALFGDTAAQYAYQSAWITPTRRDACPICSASQIDTAADDTDPSVGELRRLADRLQPTTIKEHAP